MPTVIDANMKLFAERMHITSSRMINEYGLSTVDEIIEAEAEKGNSHAVKYAKEYYHSPEKLIKLFKLTDVENRFVLLHHMDDHTREKILPLLDPEDLVQGLYFFRQEKLLNILMKVNIKELVNVIKEAFPIEAITKMYTEEDLASFFFSEELPRGLVLEQIMLMPPDILQDFIEGVTGRPAFETNLGEFIGNIANMPKEDYQKFMASIDPDVQRQLIFQITKEEPDYLQLFENETFVNMLATLMKPDMIKPMVMLDKETLVKITSRLPDDLMSIVAAQIDEKEFAKFLQHNHMKVLEQAMMI